MIVRLTLTTEARDRVRSLDHRLGPMHFIGLSAGDPWTPVYELLAHDGRMTGIHVVITDVTSRGFAPSLLSRLSQQLETLHKDTNTGDVP
jgi:hypothetical protein